MSNIKTLSLSGLQSDSSKFFKNVEKTITSASGEQYKVIFKNNIKETEVSEFVVNIATRVDYCNKNNIEFNYLSTFMFGLLDCCIEMPKINRKNVKDTIKAELSFLDLMIDMKIYKPILEEIGQDKIDEISDIVFESKNKEMLNMLSDKQISNLILNNKLEIADGEKK